MKPNIIVVMTDQQRADLRKSCGYPLDTMPFLDAWARGGTDFTCAYTANPTCMPARVSMFTGRYPSAHRVRTNHNEVDALYTEDLLDVLRAAGYRTALCGKNHSHHELSDFDFCESCGHLGYEGETNETDAEKEFADFLCQTRHMESHVPSPGGVVVQHPYRNVSSALKFIDQTSDDQPFFCWLSFAEPHNPYQVPAPYFDMFPPKDLPPITTGGIDLAAKGERFVWLRKVWGEVMPENYEERVLRARSNYLGMLRLIDDQFARLIAGLEKRKLADNTLVIFLSDHGDFAGEYGLIRKGADLPDVLTHIPMVWRGPGVQACGRRSDVFVNITDIFPTICQMLGVDTPFGVQGKSMLPLLRGEEVPAGEFDAAYSESGFSGLYWDEEDDLTLQNEGATFNMVTFDCLNTWTQCGQVRMLRRGRYKIQVDMMGQGYLYDLTTDPLETLNLWNDPDMLPVRADMLTRLMAETLRRCDPLPAPHRRYRVKVHPQGYWQQRWHAPDPGVRKAAPLNR